MTCSSSLVGARGFEPPTSSSRTTRATKLRYAPTDPASREGKDSGTGAAPCDPRPLSSVTWGVPRSALVELEVAVDLPVRNVRAVLVPLDLLGIKEVREDVLTEGTTDDWVRLELPDRLNQAPW